MRTNLILHHCITDIVNHATKLVRSLGAGQELCDFVSLCKRNEVLENVVQFAIVPQTSDLLSISEREELPFEGVPSLLLVDLAFGNWRAQRLCQFFNPRHQRFYRLTTGNCFLA